MRNLFKISLDTYPNGFVEKSGFFLSKAGERVFETAPPIFSILSFLKRLVERGVRLEYVTGRPLRTRLVTANWLGRHGFPFGGLYFGMSAEGKVSLAVQKRAALILDDDPEVLRRAKEAGIQVYSVRWPYNAGEKAVFLANWKDFLF